MKHYIIFIITILSFCTAVLSQSVDSITYPIDKHTRLKPIPPLDTNVVYIDMLDYALRVKITDVCTCNHFVTTRPIYLDKYTPISAITQGVFLKMEVLEMIQNFTVDSISDSIITRINYLLVPLYLVQMEKIPFNIPINIIVNRGINYKYLVFHYIVSDSAIFERRNPNILGLVGLEPKNKIPIFLGNLYYRNIISYNTLLKLIPKSKNSKSIEKCLKQIGVSN